MAQRMTIDDRASMDAWRRFLGQKVSAELASVIGNCEATTPATLGVQRVRRLVPDTTGGLPTLAVAGGHRDHGGSRQLGTAGRPKAIVRPG